MTVDQYLLRPWFYGTSVKGYRYVPETEDGETIAHIVILPSGEHIELVVNQAKLWGTIETPELDKVGNPKVPAKLREVRCNGTGFIAYREFLKWIAHFEARPNWFILLKSEMMRHEI
jgi:hypothetical protein